MADIKKVVEIEFDTETGEITKVLKELSGSIEYLADTMSEVKSSMMDAADSMDDAAKNLGKAETEADKLKKKTKDVDKNTTKSAKGTKGLAAAWKKVGVALKAAGIGLLVAALAAVMDILRRNQKVVDGFETAMTTLSIVVGEVADALETVYTNVSKSTENFDALGKVISGLVTLALTPMRVSWVAIQSAIYGAQLAWEKSYFGDKDPERIKELEAELSDLADQLVEIGEEAGNSAMDIYNNFSEAISEAVDIGTQVVEEVGKVSVKTAYEQAQAVTELTKAAELAEVQQQGLIEKYDREAELLRQQRDNIESNFAARIEAAEKLAGVLKKQGDEEKELIAIRKNALEEQYKARLMNEQEYLVQKQILANEEAEILARITGFETEQQEQLRALRKEQSDDLHAAFEEQEALAEAEAESRRKRREKEKKDLEDAEQAKYDLQLQGLKAAQELVTAFAGESERAQKRAFQINKALQIAQATIETYRSATAAYASQLTIPTPDAPIRAAAAAAIATAFGLAQVASIARTKFKGGASGGGDSSTPSVSSPSSIGAGAGQAPQFNTVGGSAVNQLSQSIADQNKTPVQAYVVANDVTSAQSLERNRQQQASFP